MKRVRTTLVLTLVVDDVSFWNRAVTKFIDEAMNVDRSRPLGRAQPFDSVSAPSQRALPLEALVGCVDD